MQGGPLGSIVLPHDVLVQITQSTAPADLPSLHLTSKDLCAAVRAGLTALRPHRDIQAEQLAQLAASFRHVTALDISNCQRLKPKALAALDFPPQPQPRWLRLAQSFRGGATGAPNHTTDPDSALILHPSHQPPQSDRHPYWASEPEPERVPHPEGPPGSL